MFTAQLLLPKLRVRSFVTELRQPAVELGERCSFGSRQLISPAAADRCRDRAASQSCWATSRIARSCSATWRALIPAVDVVAQPTHRVELGVEGTGQVEECLRAGFQSVCRGRQVVYGGGVRQLSMRRRSIYAGPHRLPGRLVELSSAGRP